MKLISNKSNYCTKEFLTSMKFELEKVSPLIEKSTKCENMFIENKEPMKFEEIKNPS